MTALDPLLTAGSRTADNEPTLDPPPLHAYLDQAPPPPQNGNGTATPRRARKDPTPPRTPAPYDEHAERALLGAALLDRRGLDAALAVPADAYYDTRHRHIAHAIATLAADRLDVDPTTVHHELTVTGLADTAGGHTYLGQLMVDCPTTGSAGTYARHILEAKTARDLQAAGLEIADAARNLDLERATRILTSYHTDPNPGSSWAPVDLAAVLDGRDLTDPPTILHRDDGQALIYPGKVHAFNAESESGKSWLALHACTEQLDAGHHVLYVDFEDGAGGVTGRLIALGMPIDVILERFSYVRPDDPLDTTALAHIDQALAHHPTIAILDGVTEAMVQNGWSITDNDDIARFLAALPRRIARTGTAVIMIDHVVKKRDDQGDYGIGGQHKRAGIDGASYKLEVTKPFGRGLAGTAKVTVTKDRPGHIRPAAIAGRTVGELRLTSTSDGTATCTIAAPATLDGTGHEWRPTGLMERISRTIEEQNAVGQEPTVKQILTLTKGDRNQLATALKALIAEDHIAVRKAARNAQHHTVIDPYRQTRDPASDRYEPDPDQPPDATLLDDPGDF